MGTRAEIFEEANSRVAYLLIKKQSKKATPGEAAELRVAYKFIGDLLTGDPYAGVIAVPAITPTIEEWERLARDEGRGPIVVTSAPAPSAEGRMEEQEPKAREQPKTMRRG